jgi:hypothetical protein
MQQEVETKKGYEPLPVVPFMWGKKIVTKKEYSDYYSLLPSYICLGDVTGVNSNGQVRVKGVKIAFKFIRNGEPLPQGCRVVDEDEEMFLDKIIEKENEKYA